MIGASALIELYLRGLCDATEAKNVALYLPIAVEGNSGPSVWCAGDGEPAPELASVETAVAFAEKQPVPATSSDSVGIASRDPACRLLPFVIGAGVDPASPDDEDRRRTGPKPQGLVAWIGIRYVDPRRKEHEELGVESLRPGWILALGRALVGYVGAVSRNLKDAITGLPERKEFIGLLTDALSSAREQEYPLAALFVNPDDFMAINESLGSHKGDEVVQEIAQRLRRFLRATDVVSRYGGVTFGIVLVDSPLDEAEEVAQRLLRELSGPAYLEGAARLEFSIGLAGAQPSVEEIEPLDLIRRCDNALMSAKHLDGNSIASWERSEHREGAEGFDRLAGIFTGSIAKDYRNMLLLWETVSTVAASDDLERLVHEIVDRLFAAFKPRRCGVYRLADSKLELVRGLSQVPTASGDRVLLETLDLGTAPTELLSESVTGAQPSSGIFAETDDGGNEAEFACYGVPLLAGSRCLGALYLDWAADQSALDSTDLLFLGALGSQVGLAMDRVRLADLEAERSDRERRQLRSELSTLRQAVRQAKLVYRSPEMERLLEAARRVASTDATVLITGASGTGKELFARTLHELSHRRGEPYVIVDCGAIPTTLIESELFGAERGAYTGAQQRRAGRLAEAHRGTVLLDEIGELPLEVQSKLLRFVQSKRITPVGGQRSRSVDVRILAATNRDLEVEAQAGRFREDLFYRLNVVRLAIPTLRERPDDVMYLARHFLEVYSVQYQRNIRGLSTEAGSAMMRYDWPGNVRELQNRVMQAVILCESDVLTPRDLGLTDDGTPMADGETLATARVLDLGEPKNAESVEWVEAPGEAESAGGPSRGVPPAEMLAELRRRLETVVTSPAVLEPKPSPVGRWLAEDILLLAHGASNQVAERGATIVGLANSTYRRRLAKALATSGASLEERPAIWSSVKSCLGRLVDSLEAPNGGLMQACERELLEAVAECHRGKTGLGSALLGVTPPTFRRRLSELDVAQSVSAD